MKKIKILVALALTLSTFAYSTEISPDVQKEITVAYAKFESTTRPLITNLYSLRDQLEVLQSNKSSDPKIIGQIQREISEIRKDLRTMESNFRYSLTDKYGKEVYREDIRDLLKEIGLKESDSGWREEKKGEKPVQLPVWNELPGTAKPGVKPAVPAQLPVWSEVPGTAKPGIKPSKPTQLPVWSEMPSNGYEKDKREKEEKEEKEEREEREKKEREEREEKSKKDKN